MDIKKWGLFMKALQNAAKSANGLAGNFRSTKFGHTRPFRSFKNPVILAGGTGDVAAIKSQHLSSAAQTSAAQTSVQLLDTTARDAGQSTSNFVGLDYNFGVACAKHASKVHRKSVSNGGSGSRGLEMGGGMLIDAFTRNLGLNYWWWFNQVAAELDADVVAQLLLRSQSGNGYRPFADDVIEANIKAHMDAADGHPVRGRIFDALNAPRNAQSSFEAAQKHGMLTEGMYCFNPNKHGDIDMNNAMDVISGMIQMGADSVGVKDMAGLMGPQHAYNLAYNIRLLVGPDSEYCLPYPYDISYGASHIF